MDRIWSQMRSQRRASSLVRLNQSTQWRAEGRGWPPVARRRRPQRPRRSARPSWRLAGRAHPRSPSIRDLRSSTERVSRQLKGAASPGHFGFLDSACQAGNENRKCPRHGAGRSGHLRPEPGGRTVSAAAAPSTGRSAPNRAEPRLQSAARVARPRARGRRPCSGPPGSAPRPDPGGARAPAALCGSRRAQRRDAVLASGRGDGPARSFSISEVLSGPPGRLAPSKMEKEGSTPRPPSPGRTSRSGGYHCPTAGCRIAAARLRCCVSAALRGLAVGATRLRLADAGGAGAGKCLRGSAQHAYVAGRALRRLLSGSKSSDLQRGSALRRRVSQS